MSSIQGRSQTSVDDAAFNDVKTRRIAAFPMYDLPELQEAHDQFWSVLRQRLNEAGVADVPEHVTRGMHHETVWTHPQLLLGQACEYPLAKRFAGDVRLVATPHYRAPGCVGRSYRSAIVVRSTDHASSLAELRGRRCVVNEQTSNSGMNLLRASIAPVAGGTRFFESIQVSGSHRISMQMVEAGEADVAAVDCVTFAHISRHEPTCVAALRVLDWSPCSPSLPLVTAVATSDQVLQDLRDALAYASSDSRLRAVREQLLLEGFDLNPAAGYPEVLALERDAAQLGYSELR